MMMNFDILTWINYFIGAFACCMGILYTSKILLDNDLLKIKLYKYLLVFVFTMFYIVNSLVFDNIIKLFGTLLVLFLNYKLLFNQNNSNSIIYSIVTCLLFTVSETLFAIVISSIDLIFSFDLGETIIKSMYANIIISVLVCILSFVFKNKLKKYVKKITDNNSTNIAVIGIIITFITLASIYKLSNNCWKFNYSFILNIIIIIGCILLMAVMVLQYVKNKEVTQKYKIQQEYLKTSADLIEKYSSTIHKYKNNLIAIKSYVNNDKEKANTYIDSLLDNYKAKKYSWFSKINYFEIDTLRYLLYYKLSKAEDNNLKLVVTVSKELKYVKYCELPVNEIGVLSDIIGEYFDNAIYAANESDEKILVLDIFTQDDKINFIISNTYKNDFDIDLITKSGYSTKGKGHGLGLYDIDKQLKKINYIDIDYKKIDNYFVVEVELDIIEKEKG